MTKLNKIYYFSGTGNSLAIAKDLKRKIKNSELISIIELMKKTDEIKISGDMVGFVFPVYFARVPVIIEEFLERANFGDIKYSFAVANGGGLFSNTLKKFSKLLQNNNVTLNVGYIIGMPGNHPKVHHMNKKSKEEYFIEKNEKIEIISSQIIMRENHSLETNFGVLGLLLKNIVMKQPYNLSKKHLLDGEFRVDGNCNNCGTCKKVCPVGNIEITGEEPKWLGNCLNCARCYHLCPKEAILLGEDDMPRYKNPDIELEELTGGID